MKRIKYFLLASTLVLLTAASAAVAQGRAEPFALGADISWIQQKERCGVRYYHNNQQVDPFTVLKDHGFNWIRLRLFVDPTVKVGNESESPYATTNAAYCQGASGPYCGLDSTIAMAKRTKAAGMKLLLDFHYSDTWADPGKQHRPVSWANLTTDQVIAKAREYTKESLEKFKAAGVLPDMVQIGNETVSQIAGIGISSANGARFVNSGIDGVRDVSPDVKIMVHTINERNPTGWLSTLINNGVNRINVLGLSYYSEWHGTPDSLQRVANRFASNSAFNNIQFSVVEYADNHRRVNDIVYNMPNNKGFGTFVWEPFDWRDVLFDWRSNPSGRHSNSRLQLYPAMSTAYGNDAFTSIGGQSGAQKPRSSAAVRVGHNGVINYNSDIPGTVSIYNIQGRVAGRFNIKSAGVYNPANYVKAPMRPGAYIIAVEQAGGDRQVFSGRIVR